MVARFRAGKSLRGGVAVCWPWFGPHPDDPEKPSHGFARNLDWEVRENASTPTGTRIVMSLLREALQRRLWPFPAELTLTVVFGERLRFILETRNTGAQSFVFTQALHTYCQVGDIGAVQIEGLDHCDYIDKVNGGPSASRKALLPSTGKWIESTPTAPET